MARPRRKGSKKFRKGTGAVTDLAGIFSKGETRVHAYLMFYMYDMSQAIRVMCAMSAMKDGDECMLTAPDPPRPGQKYTTCHKLTPDETAERLEVLPKPPPWGSAPCGSGS